MPEVQTWCPKKGVAVSVGMVLPKKSKLTGYADRALAPCPACGGEHPWRNLFLEGEGPARADRYWVALDQRRDIAAEIGILISCFAVIESFFPKLLKRFTGASGQDASAIMGAIPTTEGKKELLNIIQNNRGDEVSDARSAMEIIVRKLGAAIKIRNQYAHAQYGLGAGSLIHINPFFGDMRRKTPATLKKNIDDISADVRAIKELICEISEYVAHGTMPSI